MDKIGMVDSIEFHINKHSKDTITYKGILMKHQDIEELEHILMEQDIAKLSQLIDNGLNVSTEVPFAKLLYYFNVKHIKVNIDFIQVLIDNGADVNDTYEIIDTTLYNYFTGNAQKTNITITPISQSYSWNSFDKDLFYLLINKGAEISNAKYTLFGNSGFFDIGIWDNLLKLDDTKIIEDIIEMTPNLDRKNTTIQISDPISTEMSDFLIEKKFNLVTYLPHVIWFGLDIQQIDSIKKLIEFSNNVIYETTEGDSALSSLLRFWNENSDDEILEKLFNLIKLCIDNGADVNHRGEDGNTPIMALGKNYLPLSLHFKEKSETDFSEKLLILMLQNGADLHARNNMGMTPLMQYALKGHEKFVKILLEHGSDINAKSEMTAFDLAQNDEIKALIKQSRNNEPQKLVTILSNFTIDKPIKYTTHGWDFGDLRKSEYKTFDGFMRAVKKQYEGFRSELESLSPNLHKKIHTFLVETDPEASYSWSQKTDINIGWSSLEGLREHCDSNMKPETFRLKEPIVVGNQEISTFGEVINLFKQEIEIRNDYKTIKYLDKSLEEMFIKQRKNILGKFNLDLSTSKLERQFYTDTEKFDIVLDKIFDEIKKRSEHDTILVDTNELTDRSLEIRIVHVGSFAPVDAEHMLLEANDGDFADIKSALLNLCDWSCENVYDGNSYRVNYLHSNNVKDIEQPNQTPKGFTHIMRFYMR